MGKLQMLDEVSRKFGRQSAVGGYCRPRCLGDDFRAARSLARDIPPGSTSCVDNAALQHITHILGRVICHIVESEGMPDMPGVHEDCRPGTKRCRQTPARQPVRDTDSSRVAVLLQLPIYKADNHHGCQGVNAIRKLAFTILQSSRTLVRTGKLLLQCSPNRLAVQCQVVPGGAAQIQQGRRNDVGDQLQRCLERCVQVVQVVRRSHLHHLEHKTQEIVTLEQLTGVQYTTKHVIEINTGERVDGDDIAANAPKLGIFQDHADNIQVKLDEAVRRTMAVPVCWNLLVSLAIGHVAALSVAVDAEKGLQSVMSYTLVLACF